MISTSKPNRNIVLYLIPIIASLMTFVFYYVGIENKDVANGISTFSIIFNIIIVPIYLFIINVSIRSISIIKKIIYSFLSNMISIIINYCNWGIVTMLILSPDFETRMIVFLEITISCTILSIYIVLYFILMLIRHCRRKNVKFSQKT